MSFPRIYHPIGATASVVMFVDDHWIDEQIGLKRVVNRARPLLRPILRPDDPKTEPHRHSPKLCGGDGIAGKFGDHGHRTGYTERG